MRLESFKYISLALTMAALTHTAQAQAQDSTFEKSQRESFSLLFQPKISEKTEKFTGDDSETNIPLTPEQHKIMAISALKKGLNSTAIQHLTHIENIEAEYIFSKYAKALALSNMGNFDESIEILESISIERSSFKEPAKQFIEKLKLSLAGKTLNEGNYYESEQWISQLTGQHSNRESDKHTKRLQNMLNAQALKTSGFSEKTSGAPLKIALLIPLTGAYQTAGQQLLAAAQLSLFNDPNPNILLYPHDTNSTEMGAIRAVQKAINDKADIILGPLTAANTRSISQYTISANIPVISFSSDINIAKERTSILGYAPEEQAVAMAKFAADKGIKSVAVLAPNSPYGIRMSNAFVAAAHTYDISVTDNAIFDNTSPDQTKQLHQLAQTAEAQKILDAERIYLDKEYKLVGEAMDDASLTRIEELKTAKPEPIVNFEALYLPVSAEKLPLIASQLAYFNMDAENITLLGTAKWDNPIIYENRAEYVRGAYFPAPPQANVSKAHAAFKNTYNKEAQPLSILAYDGITLLNKLYQESKGNSQFITDNLFKPEGYALNGGLIKFNHNGTSQRLYSIYEVRSNSAVKRQSAPAQFPPLLPDNIDVRESSGKRGFFNPWGY